MGISRDVDRDSRDVDRVWRVASVKFPTRDRFLRMASDVRRMAGPVFVSVGHVLRSADRDSWTASGILRRASRNVSMCDRFSCVAKHSTRHVRRILSRARHSFGDAKPFPGDAKPFPGDARHALGDAKPSVGGVPRSPSVASRRLSTPRAKNRSASQEVSSANHEISRGGSILTYVNPVHEQSMAAGKM
jgi:hypothetical protein